MDPPLILKAVLSIGKGRQGGVGRGDLAGMEVDVLALCNENACLLQI